MQYQLLLTGFLFQANLLSQSTVRLGDQWNELAACALPLVYHTTTATAVETETETDTVQKNLVYREHEMGTGKV
jgi:hypothetical protein